jgi:hypothetical protein
MERFKPKAVMVATAGMAVTDLRDWPMVQVVEAEGAVAEQVERAELFFWFTKLIQAPALWTRQVAQVAALARQGLVFNILGIQAGPEPRGQLGLLALLARLTKFN